MSERLKVLPIENCPRWFRFRCPKEWSHLDRTNRFDVRHCPGCQKDVYYCNSEESLAEHRRAGHCICIEVRSVEESLTELLGMVDGDE
jgi:hypothetical protein